MDQMTLYLLCFIPPMLLALYAQGLVKSRYARASKTPSNITGYQAARSILDSAGLHGVPVEEIHQDALMNYYSPKERKICLSSEVFRGRNLAAVGIAAHEAGHAIQHAKNYPFLRLTQLAFPIASLGSRMAFTLLLVGAVMNFTGLILVALLCFGAAAIYQIINLPVEYNASNRAKARLASMNMVTPSELGCVRGVLSAAALTYVAAMISALMQFLYFALSILGRRE